MLRIAQIAPLYESVPPKLYGGTERVVAYLTDELINLGHEVTLFASGDSVTKARLIPISPRALRLSNHLDPLAYHILQLQEVFERVDEFDILHFHTDYLHFPFTYNRDFTTITTLHGRLDIDDLIPIYEKFRKVPVVSISNAQREPLPMANWIGTVPHGLPLNLYKKGEGKGDYVVFVGRISPEKRVDRAIEIARQANVKLKVAAKIDKADQSYYEREIKHLFSQPHVEFLGEIDESQKSELLQNAVAMLFPIDWREPFGMVTIEALASGTPVIAFNHGSVPEIITNGQNGYIVETIDQAVSALRHIHDIHRGDCRKCFEQRFTATIMAKNYLRLYERLVHPEKERLTSMSNE
ncbi:MAG TPA: glycosyltransferase family 4 protein [Chitinophagaceae bacterium]|nr:glycosyltransferase family 4 protein [Chitinophagaceae bacterium]